MAAGAYSSIFIATPLLVQLKARETEVIAGRDAGPRPARRARRRPLRRRCPSFAEDMPVAGRRRTPTSTTTGTTTRRRGADAGTGRRARPRRPAAAASCPSRTAPVEPSASAGRAAADPAAAVQARQEVTRRRAEAARERARAPDRRRPRLPRARGRLQGHHAAARRPRRASRAVVDGAGRGRPRRLPGAVVVDKVVGMEARGFILGRPGRAGARRRLRAGPQGRQAAARDARGRPTRWSTARRRSRCTATRIAPGERVLLVDDVLATGGTVAATVELVEQCGGDRARRRGADGARASCPAATTVGDLPLTVPARRSDPTVDRAVDWTSDADVEGSDRRPETAWRAERRAPTDRGAAPSAPERSRRPAAAMRARLARIGTRSQLGNPVLEPLFRAVRANHPKADLALLERAYRHRREACTARQMRKSGDPYITHPLAVTTILADIGMTEPTLVAALLHDTVEDTPYTLDAAARRLRRRGRPARRRRHQARQGQVRRLRAGRDHPQDDRRDVARHPGAGHQARRPAAQHAHAALRPAGDPGAESPARPSTSTPRWPTGSA